MSEDRERQEFMQDNRLDKHELKIEQIFGSLDRMEHVMERMQNGMETQAEAMKELSESMIRIATSQETMVQLSVETKANSDRLHIEEKNTALMDQRILEAEKKIDKIEGEMSSVSTNQTTQKVKLAGILSAASILGGAVASFVIPLLF